MLEANFALTAPHWIGVKWAAPALPVQNNGTMNEVDNPSRTFAVNRCIVEMLPPLGMSPDTGVRRHPPGFFNLAYLGRSTSRRHTT
jgi:hypothetical protein